MAHTPGPWRVVDNKQTIAVFAEDDDTAICPMNITARPARGPATARANAQLIAAAPELLAACRRTLGVLNGTQGNAYVGINSDGHQMFDDGAICDVEQLLSAAISLARGETTPVSQSETKSVR